MAVSDGTSRPQLVRILRQQVIRPFSDFLRKEVGAAVLLVIAATVALMWANSPWRDAYFDLFATEAFIGIGDLEIALDLKGWINDALMVLFFFVVGLEIKRELTQGELRDPRQAALPIVGAIGGMIVPALIYTSLNAGGSGADGWGIPMATDIAIVMGVVALLGSRAPSWLKLFLLALAIVDDLGAILVIAVFYSAGVRYEWLALAIAAVAVAAIARRRVQWVGLYLILGVICWVGLHEAHIHPTLTGVAFGMLAPVTPLRTSGMVDAEQLATHRNADNALLVAFQARDSVSVVEWLEHRLHPYSAYIVVPLFALANAGIYIPPDRLGDAFTNSVTWGVILGLVIGKTIGISTFTLGAVALRIGRLPTDVTPRYVIGAGAIGGIGFTVSLFVTELAFGENDVGTAARLGVLVASLVAAVIGSAVLFPGTVKDDHSMDDHLPEMVSPPPDVHYRHPADIG